jgi:hypothetical protein
LVRKLLECKVQMDINKIVEVKIYV